MTINLEHNLRYIKNASNFLIWETYVYVRSWCKSIGPQYPVKDEYKITDVHTSFKQACTEGNLSMLRYLYKISDDLDANLGLSLACEHNNKIIAEWLIDNKQANNLDECLEISCKNNRYATAELLVEKGANTLVGLRHTNSLNIRRMLYRYKQGGEVILY